MLAPMQGVKNRVFRAVVAAEGRPDVVFTEFVRVDFLIVHPRTIEQKYRGAADHALLRGFEDVFFGDAQVMAKLKESLAHIDDLELRRWVAKLKKQRRVDAALEYLAT